ncbi:MAG: hypothetical protein P8P83_02520 [Rickettsiaceae bacterium]|nr:hypothetical protein [Rickettsiaceae bacterium]
MLAKVPVHLQVPLLLGVSIGLVKLYHSWGAKNIELPGDLLGNDISIGGIAAAAKDEENGAEDNISAPLVPEDTNTASIPSDLDRGLGPKSPLSDLTLPDGEPGMIIVSVPSPSPISPDFVSSCGSEANDTPVATHSDESVKCVLGDSYYCLSDHS